MALIIGVPVGRCFYVGDTAVEVTTEHEDGSLILSVPDPENGDTLKEMYVSEDEAIEILPEVRVHVGKDRRARQGIKMYGPPRIVVDAPKHITILREELYLRANHGV